jgi:hypothetical protein
MSGANAGRVRGCLRGEKPLTRFLTSFETTLSHKGAHKGRG